MLAGLALVLAQDAPPGPPPPPPVRDLHGLLAEVVAREGLPALGALVTDGERTIAAGVAGVRVRGGQVPATLEDRWHIGSCTKSMTATLAALLEAEGKVAWDDTPASVFPALAGGMHESWRGATLERLLCNTSGAAGDLLKDHPRLWRRLWQDGLDPAAQRQLLLTELAAQPTEKPPGSGFLYSNAGFAIAGTMLERKSGVAFEELMRARLFEPLGMESAGFGAPGSAVEPDQADAPWGHDANGRPVAPGAGADNPPGISPAGRVHLALEDWAKYARFHLRGARAERPLLDAGRLARLHRPDAASGRARYAMGWAAGEVGAPKTPLLAHNGSNTMWFASIWLLPEQDLAILVVCNDGTKGAAVDAVSRTLLPE